MTTTENQRLDRLNELMGVQSVELAPGLIRLRQEVGPRFHDHRGRTVLGSIGVLADNVPGRAIGNAVPEGTQVVLSQVVAAMAGPLPATGTIDATGNAVRIDSAAGIGLSTGDMRGPDGEVLVALQSRGMVVTREAANAEAVLRGDALPVEAAEPVADAAELADRTGLAIVEDIARGALARGPLAGLLGMGLPEVARGLVVGEFAPRDWMSNPLGSIQGGVLISAADLVMGLAAQTLTAPGQGYEPLDLRIDFVRSPAADGPPIRAEAEVLRAGRRLALIESRLVDPSGRLLARAAASVQLR
ncbi:PaaI family thioesterase [Rhodococcus sp. UNC363MFTsu5.1]|uniref:PaaI family thioesterase n=1 Tax=Rhodococcus sp. UNC363MFTsu5.1 TaxID=1449069 RepID=UPI000488438B|nr:PaaI family thioesterase [Rhodococcus sp. UNC363MFTsu5.1]